jgi:hypothetical protein
LRWGFRLAGFACQRGALGLPRQPLHTLKLERGAGGLAACQQIRVGDAAGAGAIELGDQRAARVRRNGRDRSGARTDVEPMQGKRSLSFWIGRHASMSFICQDATPPPKAPRSATAVSRLRQAAFPDHGRRMKIWNGYRLSSSIGGTFSERPMNEGATMLQVTTLRKASQRAAKNKECPSRNQDETDRVIPGHRLLEVQHREPAKTRSVITCGWS